MGNVLQDGIGADTGPAIALAAPLITSGSVWYVSSVSGVAGSGQAGTNRARPRATLAELATEGVAAGSIIVLLEDHVEVISAQIAFANRVLVVGEGRADGQPTAKLTPMVTGDSALVFSGAGSILSGVYFEPPTVAGKGTTVEVDANNVSIRDCYFELDEFNDATSVSQANTFSNLTIRDCSFVAVNEVDAADLTKRPQCPVQPLGDFLTIESTVFDGGPGNGFFDGAVNPSAESQVGVRIEGVSLLRGADIFLHPSTTGWVNVETATGGARVQW